MIVLILILQSCGIILLFFQHSCWSICSHEDIRYIAVKLVYFFTFISQLKNHMQGNLRVIVLLFRHTEGVLEPFHLSPTITRFWKTSSKPHLITQRTTAIPEQWPSWVVVANFKHILQINLVCLLLALIVFWLQWY